MGMKLRAKLINRYNQRICKNKLALYIGAYSNQQLCTTLHKMMAKKGDAAAANSKTNELNPEAQGVFKI
jgi:hypothetical protein